MDSPTVRGHQHPQDGLHGTVAIVSGSVGAGHDGVAYELASRLRARGHQVEVHDLLDGFPAPIRFLLGAGYVLLIDVAPFLYELTCWLVERSRLVQRIADLVCGSARGWLLRAVAGADLVVGTYPPAGRALGQLRRSGQLQIPVVTYLTDPAPNFLWVHPDVDVHLAAGAHTAQEASDRYGVDVEAVGPLVAPAFRSVDRAQARHTMREQIGVPQNTPVALLVLGSLGIGDVRKAARALTAAGICPVVLCARNDRLLRTLHGLPGVVGLGWREDVPALVAGADVVVHNAGGLSLTESLVAGTPAVTYAALPGHGRANARSLERSGTAPWARTTQELVALVSTLATTSHLPWPLDQETATARVSVLADGGGVGTAYDGQIIDSA